MMAIDLIRIIDFSDCIDRAILPRAERTTIITSAGAPIADNQHRRRVRNRGEKCRIRS